ncbi:MAG TPA: damage-control phosphatase ARMT1 family protein [Anaerolineae bacterium]
MPDLTLPPLQVDPASLPPPILTSEPGSFARHTMTVRVPAILADTERQNAFPPEIRASLAALAGEIATGVAQPPAPAAPDRDLWLASSAGYLGRSWLDVPWYWAEAYFYRRILQATGYFVAGPWQGFDPFASTKATEWRPDAAPRALATLLDALPGAPEARSRSVLQASLWGNRIDLSLKQVAERYASGAQDSGSGLLVDDSHAVWEWLVQGTGRPGRVILIADNAGTELSMDLVLIDHLLAANLAEAVELHLKPHPFFVSDATPADLGACLAAMSALPGAAGALAGRINGYLAAGRLQVQTHWFYTSSLFYFQLPADLQARLAAARLVILKGDANYRRLLGDAHWPPSASFSAATAYFPAPLLALRTLKSELIAGLPAGLAEQLAEEDPQWLLNGSRGVIQSGPGRPSGRAAV